MGISRRHVLRLAAGAATSQALAGAARTQSYPARPVQILVPYAPGGGTDLAARLTGQWLSERLNQQFIVVNRPGAGGNVGTEMVVRANPDGYTLLVFDTSAAINATLYDKLEFVFLRDIAPIALLVRAPTVMVVNPSVPAKTVPEFIAYAKANPGKINMGSGGIGTTSHVSCELFNMMTGVRLVHVPYRGSGPARTDLLAGRLQVMFDSIALALEYVRAGQLRALAVCTPTRAEVLPDVPALGEFLPGYAADTWCGIGAPKGTPPEIIQTLNTAINAGLADPDMKARLADLGATAVTGSPADFATLLVEETEKWGRVVKFSGARAD